MAPTPRVSVVITTYNRSDALLAVLRGLALQTHPPFEVVVADDGSTAEHRNRLLGAPVAKTVKLTHVWHPDVGFTAAKVRNRGVASTSGDYLIFLDGDCIPEVDFIERHVKLAQTKCFVNGSRVLLSPNFSELVCLDAIQVCGRGIAFWIRQYCSGNANKVSGTLRLPDWAGRLQPNFSWKGIRSCNMGVWRHDFETVGGFDESFVGWGHEDADFVLRLHHAGVVRKNGFCATEVLHLWHPEAARGQASANAQSVLDRLRSGQIYATQGYITNRSDDDAVITTLG